MDIALSEDTTDNHMKLVTLFLFQASWPLCSASTLL